MNPPKTSFSPHPKRERDNKLLKLKLWGHGVSRYRRGERPSSWRYLMEDRTSGRYNMLPSPDRWLRRRRNEDMKSSTSRLIERVY